MDRINGLSDTPACIARGVLMMLLLLSGCMNSGQYRRCAGTAWHTNYHIIYNGPENLEDSISDIFHNVEASLSPFAQASVISKINRNETMMTDSILRRTFKASKYVNRISKGFFDPTVGPLVEIWGFGSDRNRQEPTLEEIKEAIASVGISECEIDGNDRMRKKSSATTFNFSAITKGVGCDLIAEMMRRNGVHDYMIEIGGEIALNGMNESGAPWRIQIDAPVVSDKDIVGIPFTVVEPGGCGMATSGNYRNYRIDSGSNEIIGHTISPITGYPVVSEVVSATIVAPDCTTADALATACMAMPADSALAMIESLANISVMLITCEDGAFTTRCSAAFPVRKAALE